LRTYKISEPFIGGSLQPLDPSDTDGYIKSCVFLSLSSVNPLIIRTRGRSTPEKVWWSWGFGDGIITYFKSTWFWDLPPDASPNNVLKTLFSWWPHKWTWMYIFGVFCATTGIIPSVHNYLNLEYWKIIKQKWYMLRMPTEIAR